LKWIGGPVLTRGLDDIEMRDDQDRPQRGPPRAAIAGDQVSLARVGTQNLHI
jgi:hypothetical protein